MTLAVTRQVDHDFGELHRRMQWWVDQDLLSCAATVVLHGTDVVDVGLFGGMAGTAAFIAPESNVAGICFTQRMPAAFHPYTYEFNRFVYESADTKKPDTHT